MELLQHGGTRAFQHGGTHGSPVGPLFCVCATPRVGWGFARAKPGSTHEGVASCEGGDV